MGRHDYRRVPAVTPVVGPPAEPSADRPDLLADLLATDSLLDKMSAMPTESDPLGLIGPGFGQPVTASAAVAHSDPVARLLTAWRVGLALDELPVTPSLGKADWALRRGQPRTFRPAIAIAAAICALLLASAGIGSRAAHPGDTLWPITQVLWTDRVDSVVAGQHVRVALTQARDFLDSGQVPQAGAALTSASVNLQQVQPLDDRDHLKAEYEDLAVQVESSMPSATGSDPLGPTSAGSVLAASSAPPTTGLPPVPPILAATTRTTTTAPTTPGTTTPSGPATPSSPTSGPGTTGQPTTGGGAPGGPTTVPTASTSPTVDTTPPPVPSTDPLPSSDPVPSPTDPTGPSTTATDTPTTVDTSGTSTSTDPSAPVSGQVTDLTAPLGAPAQSGNTAGGPLISPLQGAATANQ